LLAALKQAGVAGLSRSEMTKDVFQGNTSGRELSRLLAILQDAALVICQQQAANGPGRPVQRWFHPPRSYEKNELIHREGNSFVYFVGSSAVRTTDRPPETSSAGAAKPADEAEWGTL
jgi:hypothetical protein